MDVILKGPPGVGKTTLKRALDRAGLALDVSVWVQVPGGYRKDGDAVVRGLAMAPTGYVEVTMHRDNDQVSLTIEASVVMGAHKLCFTWVDPEHAEMAAWPDKAAGAILGLYPSLRRLAERPRESVMLDDIRCDILDTGWPIGDDSDPELTPRRLVKEVLAERTKLRNALFDITKANVRARHGQSHAQQEAVEEALAVLSDGLGVASAALHTAMLTTEGLSVSALPPKREAAAPEPRHVLTSKELGEQARREGKTREPPNDVDAADWVEGFDLGGVPAYYEGFTSHGWNGKGIYANDACFIGLDVDILTAYDVAGNDVCQWTDLRPSQIGPVAERYWLEHGGQIGRPPVDPPEGPTWEDPDRDVVQAMENAQQEVESTTNGCSTCMGTGYQPAWPWGDVEYASIAAAVFPSHYAHSVNEQQRLMRALVTAASILHGLPDATLDRVLGVERYPEHGEVYAKSRAEHLLTWLNEHAWGLNNSKPFKDLTIREAEGILDITAKVLATRKESLPHRAFCACGVEQTHTQGPSVVSVGGIYVASRASILARSAMWRAFREQGYPIISTWIDEAGPGETESFRDLWRRTREEIARADALVLYAEPGDMPLKGALIEAGMALALGKRVFVATPGMAILDVGSWLWANNVTVCSDVEDALQQAKSYCDSIEPCDECGKRPCCCVEAESDPMLFAYVYYRHADESEESEPIPVSIDIARGLQAGADPRILLADELREFNIPANDVLRVSVELSDPGNTKDTTAEPVWPKPSPEQAQAEITQFARAVGPAVRFWYTNHRGERAVRSAVPKALIWDTSTDYYPEAGWAILAHDADKHAERAFRLDRIGVCDDDLFLGQDEAWEGTVRSPTDPNGVCALLKVSDDELRMVPIVVSGANGMPTAAPGISMTTLAGSLSELIGIADDYRNDMNALGLRSAIGDVRAFMMRGQPDQIADALRAASVPQGTYSRFIVKSVAETCVAQAAALFESAAGSPDALSLGLIVEETGEIAQALYDGKTAAYLDGLVDLIYVTIGAGLRAGLPLDAAWVAVHRANMAKYPDCLECKGSGRVHIQVSPAASFFSGGDENPEVNCEVCGGKGYRVFRNDAGKVIKPPGWTVPDIDALIERAKEDKA